MESPIAANHNAGGFSSERESQHDVTSPITHKPKTEKKSKAELADKEGSSMPSSPKTKYRVGQVIKDQAPEDAKPQAKEPSQDPEPKKDPATKKKRKEPQLPVVETHDVKKVEKHELEESGIVTGRSGSKTKKSVEKASQVSWPVDSGAQGTYDIYEKLMEANGPAATFQELEAENKMLRQFLKDLNEQLQIHVERAKITNYEGKKTEFKNKSASEQIKTIVKELANNEKILAYNKEEHRKSEARLNVIKDSGYVFGIQKETLSLQAQINAIKKENKQLGLNTGNVGKDLDVIENVKGVPGNLEEAHEREKEAIKLSQKLEILKQKNSGCLEEKKRKLEKEKTLAEQIRKAEKALFGESYVSPDTLHKYEKIARQAAAAEEDFKYAQKTCHFKTTQVSRDLEELYVQHQKEQEHVDKLESVIQEQAIALKELISSEGSRLNRGAKEVLDQIRSSLEQEERNKSTSLLKNRSLEPVQLNHSTSTKHKNAIRRELAEKKPTWKETSKGERARMELNLASPILKIKINTEQHGEFSKPNRPTKVQKETPVERKKSVTEEPKQQKEHKEQTPKASKKPEVSEPEYKPRKSAHAKPEKQEKQEAEGGSPREQKAKPSKSPEKIDDNISAPLARDEDEKKAEKRKKEKENKKKVVEDDLDMDDIGQLKEEINHYSHQIQKEVDQKEKSSRSHSKKPVKNEVHNEPEKAGFAGEHKDEEHEGQVFDLNHKKEKNQPNMKLDISKAKKEELNSSERKSVKEEAHVNEKQHEKESKRKEEKEELHTKEKKSETESKRKSVKEEAPVKEKQHEPESKRKEEKEELHTKEKKPETESKKKEDDHTSVSVNRTKHETPQKSKPEKKKEEEEGDREWEDNEDFEAETKKPVKTQVKEVKEVNKPKQNKVASNDDFEEFNFDD